MWMPEHNSLKIPNKIFVYFSQRDIFTNSLWHFKNIALNHPFITFSHNFRMTDIFVFAIRSLTQFWCLAPSWKNSARLLSWKTRPNPFKYVLKQLRMNDDCMSARHRLLNTPKDAKTPCMSLNWHRSALNAKLPDRMFADQLCGMH